MSRRPQNEKADAMYDLYQQGHSLAKVGAAFGVSRQTVYKMFARRKIDLRPKPEPLPYVVFGEQRYTLRVCGYYGRTNGTRGYLHRDVWSAANGPIPPGYDIHHIDENRQNNHIDNLELLEKAEHTRRHGFRNNQHTKHK